MKKLTSFLILMMLIFGQTRIVRAADLYANEAVDFSFTDLWNPNYSVGAPDGLYTDFRDAQAFIKLDMGEGEEGRDGLTLFFQSLDYGSTAVVTFYDVEGVILGTDNELFAPGQVEWTAAYYGTEPFRYVRIESPEAERWKLDAVQATAIDTPTVEEPIDEPVEDVPTEDSDAILAGDLVKLADSDAIYVIGDDGKRHPFPNETTYFSWGYGSFDEVEAIDAITMASYLIGASVTIMPDTYLVKLQSDPKVYAVAPNHTVRWIVSEELAIELYGSAWASNVVDIADGFWTHYEVGEEIDSAADIEGWESETKPF